MERRQVARGQWDFRREHAVFGRHRTGTAVESTHPEAEGARGPHCIFFPLGRTECRQVCEAILQSWKSGMVVGCQRRLGLSPASSLPWYGSCVTLLNCQVLLSLLCKMVLTNSFVQLLQCLGFTSLMLVHTQTHTHTHTHTTKPDDPSSILLVEGEDSPQAVP
ncbi:mCG145738, isoform CRA_b [Mus musculus]|nr:mCG145738, isoform CRA_b [Mus musculus]